MRASKLVLAIVACLATVASGTADAASRRHHSHLAHRHHGGSHHYREDSTEGVSTRSDDRIYGGAYYGYFTSPSYGRFQSY